MANLAGLFKELDDSRGGSGFSFADSAADKAGVKLAQIATGSPKMARLMQQRMSTVGRETDFMPRIDRLPEGIMALQFERIYKDLESNSYNLVDREISRRIQACPVYR